jgi:hypothetical protein
MHIFTCIHTNTYAHTCIYLDKHAHTKADTNTATHAYIIYRYRCIGFLFSLNWPSIWGTVWTSVCLNWLMAFLFSGHGKVWQLLRLWMFWWVLSLLFPKQRYFDTYIVENPSKYFIYSRENSKGILFGLTRTTCCLSWMKTQNHLLLVPALSMRKIWV